MCKIVDEFDQEICVELLNCSRSCAKLTKKGNFVSLALC